MTKLKKGDMVAVLAGKDRGKRGKILRIIPDRGTALVERLNLAKHFERRTQQNPTGGIIEREAPLGLAKLAVVCPRCDRPVRVGFSVSADGTKQRVCRRCKEALGG